ncbi:hypothetical protein AB7M63_003193 [Bradyrhizobium japonicum]
MRAWATGGWETLPDNFADTPPTMFRFRLCTRTYALGAAGPWAKAGEIS